MGGETSLESARISPTEQSTILQKQTSAAMVHQLRSTNHTTSIRHLQHSRSTEPMRWGPAHHRGLGPQQRCFTCNYCQDSNKKLSVPLNKLVTHPTALT